MDLQAFLTSGVFAFILTFVRIGAAAMIMPGIGDSLAPQRIRLYIALALAFVLFPLTLPAMPDPVPGTGMLFTLIVLEFITGLFIGTLARIFISALDVAGMVISMSSGLGNAQLFNPAFAAQGSIVGAFLSVTGIVFLFSTNLHHLLFMGLLDSYEMFPVGGIPDTGSMAEMISRTVSLSFKIGVQIAAPFMVVALMVYIGMGVLSRLMPQIQVFLLALPMQILLSLITMSLVMGGALYFWASQFESFFIFFLSGG